MAYDGKLLAQARAAFEDDKARRREEFRRQVEQQNREKELEKMKIDDL